ncbi:hypothetical protein NXX91_26815 [Bacteroides thetaiotaomicron]|nr:hypothetical protein [Bacteroides thetaiotaomicron]
MHFLFTSILTDRQWPEKKYLIDCGVRMSLHGVCVGCWSYFPTEIRIGTSENVFGLHHETSDAWLLSYPYVKSFETASPVESCVLAIDWLIANGHFNKEYYNEENNVQ